MRKVKDGFRRLGALLCAAATCAVLLWVVGYVAVKGAPAIDGAFLASLWPMVVSTLYIVGISLVIATPIGVGAAIYLTEYKKAGKVVGVIRFAVESLSGIPSIIFGLFGMIFFVKILNMGWSVLAGSLTVSIMVLPLIIRSTEEALKAVPVSYREASFALGATKLRTIVRVLLPSAASGIITSIILSIGRIVGETAALVFTAGTVAKVPEGVFSSGRTLAVHLYTLAKEGISLPKAFATALVLIVLVVAINILANLLDAKIRRKTN